MADRTRSTRSARELWGDRLDLARASILAYLETTSRSRTSCGHRVYSDLQMASIDAATTLGLDALDEMGVDGLVVLYTRDDGLKMVRLNPAHENP